MEPIPIYAGNSGSAEDYILPVEYKWISGTEKMLTKYWVWKQAVAGTDKPQWILVEVM